MGKKLTPQQQLIINYLTGGNWKCMASTNFYMKDDRKRISELQQLGYVIQGEPCKPNLTGCTRAHSSKVFMRRLQDSPKRRISTFIPTEQGTMREVISYV